MNGGYYESPWPAEDGGPTRGQAPTAPGPRIGPGERLEVLACRPARGAQMLIQRAPGQLYLLRGLFGARISSPSLTVVERLDPHSLEPLATSGRLPGGPFWMGGIGAVADGAIVVVAGRHAHRLDPETLEVLATRELPAPRPHNSFLSLPDGTLVLKDFDVTEGAAATLRALDPLTLKDRDTLELGEPVIARLAARGDEVYAVGSHRVHRVRWDSASGRLTRDEAWPVAYRDAPGQGHGWDPVLAGGRIWFLDQGRHRYRGTMRGAARDRGPVHLHAISLSDPADHRRAEICGLPWGAATNPPLVDAERGVAVGYDSANGILTAFHARPGEPLTRLWSRRLNTAGHLLRWTDTGELMAYDQRQRPPRGTRSAARFLAATGDAIALTLRVPALSGALGRLAGEDTVLLDLTTGTELGRARVPSLMQSVCFPSPGWDRDFYYCSMSTVARVGIRHAQP
ncbi:YncE family protein [Streptomyces sp. NPDC086787]|uniref:YncE family protein n=1 Tax=Streptomyces sp. NPDC086787 TaxID=3365759 RepID=UPI00381B8EE2